MIGLKKRMYCQTYVNCASLMMISSDLVTTMLINIFIIIKEKITDLHKFLELQQLIFCIGGYSSGKFSKFFYNRIDGMTESLKEQDVSD